MKPYYSDESVTIYHGDCREILPHCPRVDLMLTDPPYGINLDTDYARFDSSDVQGREYARVRGDAEVMDFSFILDWSVADRSVIWGANNFPQQLPFDPTRDGWICWDKRTNEAADAILGSPFEMAVVLGQRTYKMIRLQHCGVKNGDGDRAGRLHPTQKPVRLMRRVLELFQSADTILDPFMGSGTTLRAAKDLGRKAVGVEIEERYCEVAAKRMSQEVLDFSSP